MTTQKNHRKYSFNRRAAVGAVMCIVMTPFMSAFAHGPGGAHHAPTGSPEQMAWGIAGRPGEVTRTISVQMSDDMKFAPNRLSIRLGETIRFEVRNRGKVMHEMVIGDPKTLKEHAELMKKHPNMEHDEPYMAHVSPGKRGDLIWTFNREGRFQFACLVPGHFEAGMFGEIEVRK